jgi:hypothetical protein
MVISAVPDRPGAAPLAIDHIDPFCGCATNSDPTPVDWPYLVDVGLGGPVAPTRPRG